MTTDLVRTPAVPPSLGVRAVDSLLGGGDGVDRGHQPLDDAELVVDHLGERRQAVGGARGVGDDRLAVVPGGRGGRGVEELREERRALLFFFVGRNERTNERTNWFTITRKRPFN